MAMVRTSRAPPSEDPRQCVLYQEDVGIPPELCDELCVSHADDAEDDDCEPL